MEINKHNNNVLSIEEVIDTYGFPITVRLVRELEGVNEAIHPGGELHTLQSCDELSQLWYLKPDKSEGTLNIKSIHYVVSIAIVKDVYNDLDCVYRLHRTWNIFQSLFQRIDYGWMVCLEIKHNIGVTLTPGQIFKIIRFTRCSCPCLGRSRNVKVQLYPGNNIFWLPANIQGDFRKCESPLVNRKNELTKVLKTLNFPILFKLREEDKNYTLVTKHVHEKVLVSCINNGMPEVQVFPLNDVHLKCVLPYAPPIGILTEKDLIKIRSNDQFKEHYKKHIRLSYNDLKLDVKDVTQEAPTRMPPKPSVPNLYNAIDDTEDYEQLPLPTNIATNISAKAQNTKQPQRHTADGTNLPKRSLQISSTNNSDIEVPIVPRKPTSIWKGAETTPKKAFQTDTATIISKYNCTQIEYDPDDTDPEEQSDDDEEEYVEKYHPNVQHSQENLESDDDDEDDYMNDIRIQMNNLTKETQFKLFNPPKVSIEVKKHNVDAHNNELSNPPVKTSFKVDNNITNNGVRTVDYEETSEFYQDDYQSLITNHRFSKTQMSHQKPIQNQSTSSTQLYENSGISNEGYDI